VELDAISQPELEQLERIGSADLVIGILDGESPPGNGSEPSHTAAARTREALAEFANPIRAVVLSNEALSNEALSNVALSNGGASAAVAADSAGAAAAPVVFTGSLPASSPGETPQQAVSSAYRKVFAIGGKLGARACGLIASHPSASAHQWIYRLAQPVLHLGFDLVAPCYSRQKMEGLLNRSVLAPLHRALYGEQFQNPLGPDFGVSGKLAQQILRQDSVRRHGVEGNLLASIAASAAAAGCQVCESQLGFRHQRPTDWGNLSSLLAEVLGAVFLEMEGRAAFWQSIRGSKILPRFGPPDDATQDGPPPESPPAASLDTHGMRESFQLGTDSLRDVWGLILPPTTLLELSRISRLSAQQFRLPDPIWARIIYDFGLGHRLRIISRDHLLRSFTPLYLGWIASYALEVQSGGGAVADVRNEQLCKAFEDNKSYCVSRWRWPDRFNP
jgi:glucosylglycerate synthase